MTIEPIKVKSDDGSTAKKAKLDDISYREAFQREKLKALKQLMMYGFVTYECEKIDQNEL